MDEGNSNMSSNNLSIRNNIQCDFFFNYAEKIKISLKEIDWDKVEFLAKTLLTCWNTNKKVFICGNGGSAGNAMHIANDLLYGVSKEMGNGLKVHSLSANQSVITCLANDEGYDKIFSHQLAVLGDAEDVLLVLSGKGNSENILNVLKVAKKMSIKTFAILGFGGGKARSIADFPITFSIMDMQVSEDLQLIICHMITQWLYIRKKSNSTISFQLS